MGITVRSKNYSIDLGYTGFLRLSLTLIEGLRILYEEMKGMNYHLHFKEMEMVSIGAVVLRLKAGSRSFYPFYGNTFI